MNYFIVHSFKREIFFAEIHFFLLGTQILKKYSIFYHFFTNVENIFTSRSHIILLLSNFSKEKSESFIYIVEELFNQYYDHI